MEGTRLYYEDDGTMPDELIPVAKATINQARADKDKKLLEQRWAEQKAIDQQKAANKGAKPAITSEPAPTNPKEPDMKEIKPEEINPKDTQPDEPKPAEIPPTETQPNEIQPAGPRQPGRVKKPYIEFLQSLVNKRVGFRMDSGMYFEGILLAFNNYEIKIQSGNRIMLLMKHAIAFIDILEQEELPAPTTQQSDESAPAPE